MKAYLILISACLASAVDMSRYVHGPGVEEELYGYIEELYRQTEVIDATDALTDFFVPDEGKLVILGQDYAGAEQIVHKKRQLLPMNGIMQWNHWPNVSSIFDETADDKTYQVLGFNERIIKDMNCSSAYYGSRFTIKKNKAGEIDFRPQSRNLLIYDDYVVDPSFAPTAIPCVNK